MEKAKYTERKHQILSVLHETKFHGEEQIEKRQHFRYGSSSDADELAKAHQKENPAVITARQAEKNQKKQVKKAQELNKKFKENRFGVINDEVVDMKINEAVWEEKQLVGFMTDEAEAAIEEEVKEAVRLEEEAKARRKETYSEEFKELEEEVNRCLQSSGNAGDQWDELSKFYNHLKREQSIYKKLFEDHFMGTYRQTKKAYENSRSRNKK